MENDSLDVQLIDLTDTITYFLSKRFDDNWEYKFSKKLIEQFKYKLLDSLERQKVLKISTLFNYLHKKCKYNREEIINFFESIEIENLSPIISGRVSSL